MIVAHLRNHDGYCLCFLLKLGNLPTKTGQGGHSATGHSPTRLQPQWPLPSGFPHAAGQPGQTVELSVRLELVHFFGPLLGQPALPGASAGGGRTYACPAGRRSAVPRCFPRRSTERGSFPRGTPRRQRSTPHPSSPVILCKEAG